MSEDALLISSDRITKEDLLEFAEKFGIQSGLAGQVTIVIECCDGIVWPYPMYLSDSSTNEYYKACFAEEMGSYAEALGADPVTLIVINLGSRENSRELCYWVAHRLSKRWNIILEDWDERILTPAELDAWHWTPDIKFPSV